MRTARRDLKALSQQMRHQMTVEETILWNALRGKSMGCRFRRQHPFDDVIFDFYAPQAEVAVEVDGVHDPERDAARDAHVAAAGIVTIRFTNERVRQDLERVLDEIQRVVNERL